MIAKLRIFLLVFGLAGPALAQTNPSDNPDSQGPEDLPAGDCFSPGKTESRLVVPRTKIERFAMPVVDTHSHVYAETPPQIAEWVALMDRIGVRESLILTGETGAKFREITQRYAGKYPGRFAMGAGMVQEGVDAPDSIYGERLRRGVRDAVAAGAVALGELTDKGRGLVNSPKGERAYFIDDPRFDPLWDEAGKAGIPVFVHIAEPAAFYDAPDGKNELRRSGNWSLYQKGTPGFEALLAKFETVLSRHPNTRFVAVHAFNLANDLGRVGQLLDRHPNVQVDFAARMWELARQPFSARRFFDKYPTRILFGTDNDPTFGMYAAHVRQLETEDEWFWPADSEWWRGYGMKLSPATLRRVYVENADELLRRPGGSR
ncbi:MAG TPA: amidohydrolase family protein [Thermoanaerobaculia bacterium]|jgi:predicted TIM-barrel fold metal-dependent hydrolase